MHYTVTLVPRYLLLAIVLGAGAPAQAVSGDVAFADPRDPVLRALYPRLDPDTGFSPVAEPEVAVRRGDPRSPGTGECQPGFRIAEARTRDWTVGGTAYLLATFLVTTDAKPGVPAPCYRPEPWVCVLDKTRAGALDPLDCLKIEPDLFPLELSLDTARFDLNDSERAFGVRFRSAAHWRWGSGTDAALALFRLRDRRLSQVLALRMGHELDDHGQGGACARELVLAVEKTRSRGFFDWSVRVGRNEGPAACEIRDDPVGTYRWDGARYVKAARRK